MVREQQLGDEDGVRFGRLDLSSLAQAADPALVELVRQALPVAELADLAGQFARLYAGYEHGLVLQALAAAVGDLRKESATPGNELPRGNALGTTGTLAQGSPNTCKNSREAESQILDTSPVYSFLTLLCWE